MKPFIHKYVHILFCVMLGVLTFYVIPYHKMKLSAKVQREILGELGSTQQLRESLDTLETVMAFLAPAVGVSVNMKLSTFAENLKMQFSSKVSSWCYVIWCNIHIKIPCKIQQHCQLSHVLSLWETMSIALAVQHVMRKQV